VTPQSPLLAAGFFVSCIPENQKKKRSKINLGRQLVEWAEQRDTHRLFDRD
jgi:hypothetical protein